MLTNDLVRIEWNARARHSSYRFDAWDNIHDVSASYFICSYMISLSVRSVL